MALSFHRAILTNLPSSNPRPSRFLFLAGLHRSGTTLLYRLIRRHPGVSGFHDTGVRMDEGQFLQDVYPPGNRFGGPGRFALDPAAHMDESHPLATAENARRLLAQWGRHLDLSRPWLVEKSPPNIVRTRFLQALFPGSRFLVLLRHPLAVAYATRKWCPDPVESLVEHSLVACEHFFDDRPHLAHSRVIRYEELVQTPGETLAEIFRWLELEPLEPGDEEIRPQVNAAYFAKWRADRQRLWHRLSWRWPERLEARANRLGYSLLEPERLLPLDDT